MAELVKTGFDSFDKAAGGGLPPRSSILLMGPPGPEKNFFAQRFVEEGIASAEPSLFFSTDAPPAQLETEISGGEAARKARLLKFVDCYSWMIPEQKPRSVDQVVSSSSDLTNLFLSYSKAMEEVYKAESNHRIVFRSLSTLFIYNAVPSVSRFLQVLNARTKAATATTLFLLDEGMHDPVIVNSLQHFLDGVIHVRPEGASMSAKMDFVQGGRPFDWTKL